MPSTTAGEQDRLQCLPPISNPISAALEAHQELLRQLARWDRWQADQGREGAHKLTLYTLIRDTLTRRRPGGDWADVDSDVIPDVDDLWDLLDRGRYQTYETLLESLRQPPEEAAIHLVKNFLEPDYAREYLASLPYVERLEFANEIATGLTQTENGLLYIGKSLFKPVEPGDPLPLFHPDSLFNVEVDFFSTNFPWMRRAGKVYVDFYLKMVKAMVKSPDQAHVFITASAQMLNRYFPDLFTHVDGLTREELKQGVVLARQRYGVEGGRLGKLFGASVPSLIGVVIEVINVYIVVGETRDLESWQGVRLARALASLASAVSSAQEAFGLPSWLKIAGRFGVVFNVVTGFVDVILAVRGSQRSWYDKDYSVAAGQIIQGIGLGTAAAVSAWSALAALTAGSAAATSFAPPVAAVVATVVALGGALIIVTTAEGAMELWWEHSYFGTEWEDVETLEGPGTRYFLWRTPTGQPNFPRQVSAYLSTLQPVPLTIEQITYWPGGSADARVHGIRLMAPPDSGLEGTKLFVKKVQYDYVPGVRGPRYVVRAITELSFSAFTDFGDGRRVHILDANTLWGGNLRDPEDDFSNWILEIDVVPIEQVALDWDHYRNIPDDDPNYLAPYLFARRIRGGGNV